MLRVALFLAHTMHTHAICRRCCNAASLLYLFTCPARTTACTGSTLASTQRARTPFAVAAVMQPRCLSYAMHCGDGDALPLPHQARPAQRVAHFLAHSTHTHYLHTPRTLPQCRHGRKQTRRCLVVWMMPHLWPASTAPCTEYRATSAPSSAVVSCRSKSLRKGSSNSALKSMGPPFLALGSEGCARGAGTVPGEGGKPGKMTE